MIIKNASLETVCGYTSKLPKNTKPEIAFAGKSNVGKSSLINARRIVQIQVIRTAIIAIVTVTADKGDRREQEHRPTPHPISLYSFF